MRLPEKVYGAELDDNTIYYYRDEDCTKGPYFVIIPDWLVDLIDDTKDDAVAKLQSEIRKLVGAKEAWS